MAIMTTILMYMGGVCGVLASLSMLLHIAKLDETKYGKLFCTASSDFIGLYKSLSGNAPVEKK